MPALDDELSTEVGAEVEIESSGTSDVEGVKRVVEELAAEQKPRVVPPTGDGQKIFQMDSMLNGYKYHLEYRYGFPPFFIDHIVSLGYVFIILHLFSLSQDVCK